MLIIDLQNALFCVSFELSTLMMNVFVPGGGTHISIGTPPRLERLSQMFGSGITKPSVLSQVPTSREIGEPALMV